MTDPPDTVRGPLGGLGAGLVVADWDGRIAFANDAARRLLGCEAAYRLLGTHVDGWLECEADEQQAASHDESVIQRILRTGQRAPCMEGAACRVDGMRVPAVIEAIPVATSAAGSYGAVLAFSALGRPDLGPPSASENALSIGVFNGLPGPFYVFDADGRMLWWNRPAEVVTGYTSEQFGRLHPVEFFAPESRAAVEQAIAAVLRDGQAEVEAELQTADGASVPYRFAASRLALGDRWVIIGLALDISERKQIETALRESEQRFRVVFERAALGIAVVDEAGRPRMVNPALARMLGRSADVLQAMSFDEFTHPDDIETDRTLYRELVAGKRDSYQLEKRFVWPDGEIVWGRLNVSKLPGYELRGGAAMLAMVEDITERRRAEAELRRNHERLADAQRIAGLGNWEWDVATGVLWWSQEIFRMFGLDPQQFQPTYEAFLETVHPDDRASLRQAVQEALAGKHYSLDHRIIRPDGTERIVHEEGEVAFDERGEPSRMRGTVQDVTERRRMEAALRRSAKVFECTHEGILVTDEHGRIVAVNKAFTDITGYEEDEVIGESPSVLQSGRQDAAFYKAMWESIRQTGGWQGEIWNRRKDGSIYPEWLTISTVLDESGRLTNYVGIFSDITHIKQSQQELEYLAHHDPLTGLPNRLLFRARLEHSLARVKREGGIGAVAVVDLDDFKHINDSLGHSAGDELLKGVASRLLQVLREEDTVARMGGDEFLITMEGLRDEDEVGVLMERVRRALAEPLTVDGEPLSVSASIGVSFYPRDGSDVETLLKNADAAMYRAKTQSRSNYWFYSEDMTREAYERVVLRGELRRALAEDEMVLHYQPQVCMETGRLSGLEALLRWNHPERGLVAPHYFIPAAETSGMIVPLGDRAIRLACAQAREWLDQGLDFGRIAVNVSALQFHRGGLVETVREAISEAALPPGRLELEVTETGIMEMDEAVLDVVGELRGLGVSLAVDDFGTGYSSLGYLKRLAFDRLKIDKSFVDGLPTDPHDVGIVRAIVGIAHALDLSLIAEGVETERQRDFLVREGVTHGQGFLWAAPAPAPDITSFQTDRNVRLPATGRG